MRERPGECKRSSLDWASSKLQHVDVILDSAAVKRTRVLIRPLREKEMYKTYAQYVSLSGRSRYTRSIPGA